MRKIFHRDNFIIIIFISLVFILASCAKEKEYACTRGTGITMSCGDMTSYWCDEMNGTWYKGKKCSDLGFTSSQHDDFVSPERAKFVFADSPQKSPSGKVGQ